MGLVSWTLPVIRTTFFWSAVIVSRVGRAACEEGVAMLVGAMASYFLFLSPPAHLYRLGGVREQARI